MRLAFLGTPDTAVAVLRALVDDGHEVAVVVTRADTRRGRGGAVTPSPVKAAASELGIPVVHRSPTPSTGAPPSAWSSRSAS